MNENLISTMFYTIFFIIAVCISEEIICFAIIKSKRMLDNYKESKKSKAFLPYSLYLYKSKKYLLVIKSILISAVFLTVFLSSNSHTYYDIKGNSYKNNMDILFYDKDSKIYSIDKDSKSFLDSDNCLVDSNCVDINGYVIKSDDGLYISGISGVLYSLNGEIYFDNRHVYWDENKQMHYFNSNNDIIINDYKFIVDTKSGDCSIERIV